MIVLINLYVKYQQLEGFNCMEITELTGHSVRS